MTDEEIIEECIGTLPKRRAYNVKNRCPVIKKNGVQCGGGVMSGSTKCATHSGLTGPLARAKHNAAKVLASPAGQAIIIAAMREGEEITDPGQLLRKAAATLQRITEHFGEKLGDGSTEIADVDLQRWLAIFDRLTHLCTDLVKLGVLEKAVDASEIVFRREYQELAAELLDALEEYPEARWAVAQKFTEREARRIGA